MAKAIFLDRDGTINVDSGYVYKPSDLQLINGVEEALHIFQELGYLLIVITNQSGVGRGYYTLGDVHQFNSVLSRELRTKGITIAAYYICPHAPNEECTCRKPNATLINEAVTQYNIDRAASYMFGDKQSDVECGENANVTSYLITPEHSLLYWAKQLKNKSI